MRLTTYVATLVFALMPLGSAAQSDEITLFDSAGKPTAYIADDLTIYLWSGKPVAYLSEGNSGTDVYGFNGKHLGWFVKGVVRDHDGNAACGVRQVVQSPQYEPYKAYKEYKPYKSYKEYAPYRPYLSNIWSPTPCRIALGLGA